MMLRRDRAMLAVLILLDVAFHGGGSDTVNAADIATRGGLARRGIEPLLQTLSRAGLLISVRGPRGGYRLGRPAGRISLADITHALAGDETPPHPGATGEMLARVVTPLWAELETHLTTRLMKLTLADLLRRAEDAGLTRGAPEPIAFSI